MLRAIEGFLCCHMRISCSSRKPDHATLMAETETYTMVSFKFTIWFESCLGNCYFYQCRKVDEKYTNYYCSLEVTRWGDIHPAPLYCSPLFFPPHHHSYYNTSWLQGYTSCSLPLESPKHRCMFACHFEVHCLSIPTDTAAGSH